MGLTRSKAFLELVPINPISLSGNWQVVVNDDTASHPTFYVADLSLACRSGILAVQTLLLYEQLKS